MHYMYRNQSSNEEHHVHEACWHRVRHVWIANFIVIAEEALGQ